MPSLDKLPFFCWTFILFFLAFGTLDFDIYFPFSLFFVLLFFLGGVGSGPGPACGFAIDCVCCTTGTVGSVGLEKTTSSNFEK